MKRVLSLLLCLFIVAGPVFAGTALEERQAQNKRTRTSPNIYKVTAKTGVAFRIQTAVGYTTTIDLPEEAMKVFVGDADLFKVEVYDRQVLIKPMTEFEDARTNVTLYTPSGRLTFDVTVGSPDTADFVLDFRYPEDDVMVQNEFKAKLEAEKAQLQTAFLEKKKKQDDQVRELAEKKFEDGIKNGAFTKNLNRSVKRDGVKLKLLSLVEVGDMSYLRFSISNDTTRDYAVERIVAGKETVRWSWFHLRRDGFVPVDISENIARIIPPNSHRYGLLSFEKISLRKNERFLLRLFEQGNDRPLEINKIPVEAK